MKKDCPKFLICENPMAEYGQEYILYTKSPMILAKVREPEPDGTQQIDAIWVESPGYTDPLVLAKIMRRMGDWFQAYCKWEEDHVIKELPDEDF